MNSKIILIIALFAVSAIAQYPPHNPASSYCDCTDPDCVWPEAYSQDEQECMDEMYAGDDGYCFFTWQATATLGCQVVTAETQCHCTDACEGCLECIYAWGCCPDGDWGTDDNLDKCMNNCIAQSSPCA